MNARRDGPPAAGLGLASLAIPVTVIAVAALLATAAGSGRPGHGRAVGFAATVCLTGAVAGWMVTVRPALTPMGRVTASLASLSLRLFPALMALGWLQAGGDGSPGGGSGGPAGDFLPRHACGGNCPNHHHVESWIKVAAERR